MVERGEGQVLVITSASAAKPTPGAPLYSAARAGATMLVRNVAGEVARSAGLRTYTGAASSERDIDGAFRKFADEKIKARAAAAVASMATAVMAEPVAEADQLQLGAGFFPRVAVAGQLERDCDIFERGHGRQQVEGLQHHSDRGCQYTSQDYRAALDELGINVSMSRKGNCWDNAVTERFFLNLKMERLWRRQYANHAEARIDTIRRRTAVLFVSLVVVCCRLSAAAVAVLVFSAHAQAQVAKPTEVAFWQSLIVAVCLTLAAPWLLFAPVPEETTQPTSPKC